MAKKSPLEKMVAIGLKGLTEKLASYLPPEIPEPERKRLKTMAHREMLTAYETLRSRFRRRAEQTQGEPTLNVSRLKVTTACKVLNLEPPKVGKPVDLEVAKKHQRAAMRAYHPDVNPNGREEFQAAVAAYETLVEYNDALIAKAINDEQERLNKPFNPEGGNNGVP